MKLSEVPIGYSAKVVTLVENEITPKLRAIGLLPGSKVRVVKSAPLNDPRIYQVFDKLVALRQTEAQLVEVETMENKEEIQLFYALEGRYIVSSIISGRHAKEKLKAFGIEENKEIVVTKDDFVQTNFGRYPKWKGIFKKVYVTKVGE